MRSGVHSGVVCGGGKDKICGGAGMKGGERS